jgi:hypothetical protein
MLARFGSLDIFITLARWSDMGFSGHYGSLCDPGFLISYGSLVFSD